MKTALSNAQVDTDKQLLGTAFKSHRRIDAPPTIHAPVSTAQVEKHFTRIQRSREVFIEYFHANANVMTITYEEMTNDIQVNLIPESMGRRLLSFLELPYHRLTNTLRKTMPEKYQFTA